MGYKIHGCHVYGVACLSQMWTIEGFVDRVILGAELKQALNEE